MLGALAAMLALAPAALANTYVANKLGDHGPNACTHSDCTLREAITKANHHPGHDTIVLQAGKTYNLSIPNVAGDEDLNATGDLDILGSLKIVSSNKKRAKVDANGIDRVFEVGPASAVSASFKYLKIRGGMSSGNGGGIELDNGSLGLTKSAVTGNAGYNGGGIATSGPLTISKSTISGNSSAAACCGGIWSDGAATINRSTISGNFAASCCGGIGTEGDLLSVTNSTIADNVTNGSGGGVNSGATLLNSVTVVRNRAEANDIGTGDGGGIYRFAGSFVVRNSIVALNTVGQGGSAPDCFGSFSSAGVNLLTSLSGCTGFGPPNIVTSDPKLGSLHDNGGPTKTIALHKHSKAINHAGSGSPKRDQRGVKRHNPDIGAFEKT
jgi:CSLREA domain-containing protein